MATPPPARPTPASRLEEDAQMWSADDLIQLGFKAPTCDSVLHIYEGVRSKTEVGNIARKFGQLLGDPSDTERTTIKLSHGERSDTEDWFVMETLKVHREFKVLEVLATYDTPLRGEGKLGNLYIRRG